MVAQTTGDPVTLLVPANATEAARAQLRTHLGLDRPLPVQYGLFLLHAVQGDFGTSFVYRQPVSSLVAGRLGATFELALAAFAIALLLGVGLGMAAALHRGGGVDLAVTGFSMVGLAVPPFWLGLMLIVVFAVRLRLLPVSGSEGAASVVLPAVTLSLQSAARLARLLRSSMVEALAADHIRAARARGLTWRRVLWVHALRNALIPLVTMAGLELGDLISSAVVVEAIFAWPGLGRLAVTAVAQRDFPLLQGAVLVVAVCFVSINLVVDWLYTRIDPRVRLR